MKKGLALKIFFAAAAAILLSLLIACNQPASGGGVTTSSFNIRFDESKITCYKQTGGDWKEIKNNASVFQNDTLSFQGKLVTGKKVKQWIIGGKSYTPRPEWGNGFGYRVNPADAVSGNINVSFTEEAAQEIKIFFADATIKCQKKDNNKWEKISPDTAVWENTSLRFIENNQDNDKVADWKVNDNNHILWGKYFYYDVKLADKGADGKIQVTMTQRPVESITVKVLKPDIKCFKNNGETMTEVDLPAVLKEKTKLVFKTGSGASVRWIINDRQWSESNEYQLYVHKFRADGTNTITIDYK